MGRHLATGMAHRLATINREMAEEKLALGDIAGAEKARKNAEEYEAAAAAVDAAEAAKITPGDVLTAILGGVCIVSAGSIIGLGCFAWA